MHESRFRGFTTDAPVESHIVAVYHGNLEERMLPENTHPHLETTLAPKSLPACRGSARAKYNTTSLSDAWSRPTSESTPSESKCLTNSSLAPNARNCSVISW